MSRLTRIGLCLLFASLPLAGLQAQPARCDDGIRSASPCGDRMAKGSCCCSPNSSGCTCQAPTKSPAPSADHAAVPAPAHSLDELAVLVHVAHAAVSPALTSVAAADSHPIQVHPEKMLAHLHVLQI